MKKGYLTSIILLAAMTIATVESCKKPNTNTDDTGGNGGGGGGGTNPVVMTEYDLPHPAFYPQAVIPDNNKMYEERIELGKQLFFDTRLSNDGSNCASCHEPQFGFSKNGVSPNPPDNGLTSLPLINLAWYNTFFWNGRITGTLEDVMLSELTNRFNTDMVKMNAIEEYRTMFKQYYDVDELTAETVALPLAQYMRYLVSKDTRDEAYTKGQGSLTAEELAGRYIFFTEVSKGGADCFHCHVNIITTDNLMHNNGLDSTYTKEMDKGLYNITKDPNDLGKFRTPSLRNVALRTNFMHDGRFTTLEEVVNFYDHGVNMVSNVDPLMTKPDKINGLNLTEEKKKQLVAYLKTLTDTVMVNNPNYRQ